MRLNLLTSFVLAAVTLVAPVAGAATITQTFTQPQTVTQWTVEDILFNQFNPLLGTLNSVTVAFN